MVFWKRWARWWENITNFNIREEDHIHKSILFGFPGTSDVINYCILYAKYYIYLEKPKRQQQQNWFECRLPGVPMLS